MKRTTLTAALLIMLIPSLTAAVQGEKKRYNATRVTETPVIDGVLDEKAWDQGEWTDDFTQFEPFNGRKPSQHTEFKILFDDNNLYVGVKSFDSSPDSIVRRLSRRDHEDGDLVSIIFDSFHDLRTGFFFGVSAGGVKFDQMMTDDGETEDLSWDPNWWAETSINSEGWIAEMKIPFSQLRFKENSGEVWGLELMRTIYRKKETNLWQFIPSDAPGIIHLFGELGGLEQVKPRKIFDITPYGVARADRFSAVAGDPFSTGKKGRLNGGVDAKIGVTNNLTLDLTVNPDFGQVEADPSEVNLTAYETFFKEKRPFFIEGNNILSFGLGIGDGSEGNDNLFYSRRIGRSPQIEPNASYGLGDAYTGYVRTPDRTSILGAAKLTGKTQKGLSVGFMNALTDAEVADIDTAGKRSVQVVEPMTNYMAARVQQDLHEGNTIIGGMLTSVNRFMDKVPLSEDPGYSLRNTLTKAAYSGGLDFTQYFHNKNYMLTVNTAFSYIEGTSAAILKEQESSARYLQKPGNRISLDSSRTSLSGNGGKFHFMKIGNGHWNYGAAFVWKTPGLELNDIGYLRESDNMLQVVWANYRLWEPKGFYRTMNINANQYAGWDFTGNHLFDGVNSNVNINFKNYWFFHFGTNLNYNVISNSILRGGPVMKLPGSTNTWMFINTDSRKKMQLELQVQHSLTFEHAGHSLSIQPELTYKPVNNLSLSLSPNYLSSADELQYVTQTSYGSQTRYIYGTIDQKVLGLSLRVNFNLTPDLSFQYWGQPFVASGKYDTFKYITNPAASEYHDRFETMEGRISWDEDNGSYGVDENRDSYTDYSFEKPDFNYRAFLSNLVIRWEYNPGSSIYLVWSQTRDNDDFSGGMMNYSNDMGTLFREKPYNIFLVKFSYRFGLK